MKNLRLIILLAFLASCNLSEDQAPETMPSPTKTTINIFNIDTIGHFIDLSYQEMDKLSASFDESMFCNWLKTYKNSINDKILNSPNYDKQAYKIVSYLKRSEDEYLVIYDKDCESAQEQEIPAKVLKSVYKTMGCTKPEENRFQPKAYSKCMSKSYKEEFLTLVQVWSNKK